MGVVFDILGSFVVRAAIVAIILNLMLTLHQSLQKSTEEVYMNEVLSAPVQTIQSDLKLAGYNASKTFNVATSSEMRFYADIDNNGTSETVRYYANNGILYRTINGGTPFELARSVTNFRLEYFYADGTSPGGTLNVSNIKSISFRIRLQSVSLGTTSLSSGKSDSTYYHVQWEEQIFPPNL